MSIMVLLMIILCCMKSLSGTPIFNILIITTIISCVLSVIPIFFYNLKEKDHKKIIEELKEKS